MRHIAASCVLRALPTTDEQSRANVANALEMFFSTTRTTDIFKTSWAIGTFLRRAVDRKSVKSLHQIASSFCRNRLHHKLNYEFYISRALCPHHPSMTVVQLSLILSLHPDLHMSIKLFRDIVNTLPAHDVREYKGFFSNLLLKEIACNLVTNQSPDMAVRMDNEMHAKIKLCFARDSPFSIVTNVVEWKIWDDYSYHMHERMMRMVVDMVVQRDTISEKSATYLVSNVKMFVDLKRKNDGDMQDLVDAVECYYNLRWPAWPNGALAQPQYDVIKHLTDYMCTFSNGDIHIIPQIMAFVRRDPSPCLPRCLSQSDKQAFTLYQMIELKTAKEIARLP